MKLDEYTMSVKPGDGLVGRFPAAVLLLVGPRDDPAEQDRLIDLFAANPGVGDGLPGKLEELFANGSAPAVSAFAAVVERPDGVSVYLHGPVEVAADSANAELRAWGPGPAPLQRYDAPALTGALTVRCADEPLDDQAGTALALRTGVVSGSGLVLRRKESEAADDEPMMAEAHEVAEEPAMAAAAPRASAPPRPAAAQRTTAQRPTAQRTTAQPRPSAAPRPVPPPTWAGPATPVPPTTWSRPTSSASPGGRTTHGKQAQGKQAPPVRGINPGHGGRIGARLLVSATLGVVAAVLLALLLPVGFATAGETFASTLIALAVLTALGVVLWDSLYSLVQSRRAARDWPAALAFLQAVPEAVLAYFAMVLVLPSFVVDDLAVAIAVAVCAIAVAAGSYLLRGVPGVKGLVVREGPGSTGSSSGPGSSGTGSTADEPGTSAAASAAPMVWGVHCQRGHFNRPDARYCGACGTAMHSLTREPRQGPRPTLGYLVSDDGASHPLDHDYTLGTAPDADPRVRDGQARPLALSDPTGELAGAHADIRLDQWEVSVADRGHGSGTHVREPDGAGWVRLVAGQPFAITPGTEVRVGSRTFTFHGANQR